MSHIFPDHVKDVLSFLPDNYLFTGSRALGVETKKSDWDFVVSSECTYSDRYDLWEQLYYRGYYAVEERSEQYSSNTSSVLSVYIPVGTRFLFFTRYDKINVIFEETKFFPAWVRATKHCLSLDKELIKNKADRIFYFWNSGVPQ